MVIDLLLGIAVLFLFVVTLEQHSEIEKLKTRTEPKIGASSDKATWDAVQSVAQQVAALAAHFGVYLGHESGWVVKPRGTGGGGGTVVAPGGAASANLHR